MVQCIEIFGQVSPHLPHGIRAALDFVLSSTLVRLCTAYYVISVRRFGSLPASIFFFADIRLPSDSTSRWTPLPSANASYCRARCGLSPLSCCSCRAHQKCPMPANAAMGRKMLDTEGNSALAELGRATSSLEAVLLGERKAAGCRCIFIQIEKACK